MKVETTHHEGGVFEIKLNRPDKINAIDTEMAESLHDAWAEYEASEARCALVTAAGTKSFSVGADLNDEPVELWRAIPGLGVTVTKPFVVATFGYVVGGAYVLTVYADMVVGAKSTTFYYPEAQVGFTGGLVAGTAVRVPQKIASEFMLMCEPFPAERALHYGMMNRITEDDDPRDEAMEVALKIASNAPKVNVAIKSFVDQIVPSSASHDHALTRKVLWDIQNSADKVEGIQAFKEKRTPKFTGE